MFNRRKTVVLVNDQNRYVVVLHGLKAKDFKNLDQLIMEAIEKTFQEEGIKDEIIDKYLHHSQEIVFTKTKDRTAVSRMNRACENIYFFQDYFETDTIFNTNMSLQISRLMVGEGKSRYFDPNKRLYQELEVFAGESIFKDDFFILTNELAVKKWESMPNDIREKLIKNVFCANCLTTTTIVDYEIDVKDRRIVLIGFCKKCDSEVARVID